MSLACTKSEGRCPVENVSLITDGVRLTGQLAMPPDAGGLVVIAQDEPGGAAGPRAVYLARLIRLAGFATLACDLRAECESERGRDVQLDADRLAMRLEAWIEIVRRRPILRGLPRGLVGHGAAGAAAVLVAVRSPDVASVLATVAGRADLVADALPGVRWATLLVTGEYDQRGLRHDRSALRRLRGHRRLEIVPGAHHNFRETNALARVAVAIRRWMRRYLIGPVEPAEGTAQPRLRLL